MSDTNSGPGWYEVIHPQNATTEIVLVMEDGSIYAPERVITRGEFLYASARGQAHRLIRADDLAEHDAKVRAEALRDFATWLDGGTPRAWGFHHPCDPPGVRWEPTIEDQITMRYADYAREVADRIERKGN